MIFENRRDCTATSRRLHGNIRGSPRCIFVKKGLTTLCHAGISGVGAQTLLCSARACTLVSGIFFLFFLPFDDYRGIKDRDI